MLHRAREKILKLFLRSSLLSVPLFTLFCWGGSLVSLVALRCCLQDLRNYVILFFGAVDTQRSKNAGRSSVGSVPLISLKVQVQKEQNTELPK